MTIGKQQFTVTNSLMLEVESMFDQILSSTKIIAENNSNSSASTEELSSNSLQIADSMKEISFISQESVEMFEELIEISNDELIVMEKLLLEAKKLLQLKAESDTLISIINSEAVETKKEVA